MRLQPIKDQGTIKYSGTAESFIGQEIYWVGWDGMASFVSLLVALTSFSVKEEKKRRSFNKKSFFNLRLRK